VKLPPYLDVILIVVIKAKCPLFATKHTGTYLECIILQTMMVDCDAPSSQRCVNGFVSVKTHYNIKWWRQRKLLKQWMNFKILKQKCIRNKGQLSRILRNKKLEIKVQQTWIVCWLAFLCKLYWITMYVFKLINNWINNGNLPSIKLKGHSLQRNIRTSTTH
jgi:hypothetical protein